MNKEDRKRKEDFRKKLEIFFEKQSEKTNNKSLVKILKKKIDLLEESIAIQIEHKTIDVLVNELEKDFFDSASSQKNLIEIDKILKDTYKKIIHDYQSISIK